MSEPITIKHWGGAAKLCDDCHLEKKGKRLVVHFAHGHWIEFLTKTGLMAPDGSWEMCADCTGTGKDDASWDGRCPFCRGTGEVWIADDDWYRQDDDEEAP